MMPIKPKVAEKEFETRGAGYLRKTTVGTFRLEDKWIVIEPAPSFISWLLEFFN